MKLSSYAFTGAGCREENQDSLAYAEAENAAIYIVADGLGGLQDGKEASSFVANYLLESWKNKKPDNLEGWLMQSVSDANSRLVELKEEKNSTMRTTVVALLIDGEKACWAHTGDSRLYHLSESKLAHYTNDHSAAYVKYKMGDISRAQINCDKDQNKLLKSIGGEQHWEPEVKCCNINQGDGFLLCTDGMWELLFDDEILVDWLKAANAGEWAERVMQRAIARYRPNNDNLTLISVMLG